MIKAFTQKLTLTLDMIKFKHSVFALPFALTCLFYATQGQPTARQLTLIILCMVTARSAAMTFNRIADRDIDKLNPRTRSRPLAADTLSVRFSLLFCLANMALFIFFSFLLNKLSFYLSPLALIILLGYSLTKRLTHWTQVALGLALGISPLAAWIAATGQLQAFPAWVALGVFFWVAGFDLIYSCQDHDFDRDNGLKNIVVRLGIARALGLAKAFHVLCLLCFFGAGWVWGSGGWYYLGLATMSGFLAYEHRLVKPHDLSRVDVAFFTLNGYVSLAFLAFSLLDLYADGF